MKEMNINDTIIEVITSKLNKQQSIISVDS